MPKLQTVIDVQIKTPANRGKKLYQNTRPSNRILLRNGSVLVDRNGDTILWLNLRIRDATVFILRDGSQLVDRAKNRFTFTLRSKNILARDGSKFADRFGNRFRFK